MHEITPDAVSFIIQNPHACADLKVSEIEQFAEWHAGNLFVMAAPSPRGDDWHVKLHDTWGGDDEIVVHEYHSENPDLDYVEEFTDSRKAFVRFLQKIGAIDTDPLAEFVEVWSDGMLHAHIGDRLTCTEAEALAGALTALGAEGAAASLIESHALGDEPDDMHYAETGCATCELAGREYDPDKHDSVNCWASEEE